MNLAKNVPRLNLKKERKLLDMGIFDEILKKSKELQEKGVIDDFLKGMEENATNQIRRKYQSMSASELKAEWERVFKNRSFTPNNMYAPNSANAILDEVYERRIDYKNWKYKYDKAMKAKKDAEMRMNEEIRFRNSLGSNAMVKQIIEKIDNLGYEAFGICVGDSNVVVLDENEKEILSIKYVKYGYPKLNDRQIKDLKEYIWNNVKLVYAMDDYGRLELNDAPGGMKTW